MPNDKCSAMRELWHGEPEVSTAKRKAPTTLAPGDWLGVLFNLNLCKVCVTPNDARNLPSQQIIIRLLVSAGELLKQRPLLVNLNNPIRSRRAVKYLATRSN